MSQANPGHNAASHRQHAASTPHSILKKTHPASRPGTPRSRSRSPAPAFRVDGGSSTPATANSTTTNTTTASSSGVSSNNGSAVALAVNPPESVNTNANMGTDLTTVTSSTPFQPSPLRSESHNVAFSEDESSTDPVTSRSSAAAHTSSLSPNDDSHDDDKNPSSLYSTQHQPNLPSILRSSVGQPSPSEEEPQDANLNVNFDEQTNSPRGQLLHLPHSSKSSVAGAASPNSWAASSAGEGGIASPSSIVRSASPMSVSDRSRIVGRGGYGGRRGGPALNKNRTSSSGGLSDVDMRPGYERKVGFDTMIDADDTPNGYFTFCLQVKSRGYLRNKNTRTFMCAVDDNGYSERALEWLMESLVSDGDEIVALRVLDGDPDEIDQDAAREEARDLMASIVELNDEYGDRSISIVVEFIAGRVTSTIMALIHVYRPDSVTVGTRGRSVSAFQKMLGGSFIGSCSRDILNRSPVPVVIVRPEAKVKKHLAKRQNDPKRRSYHDLVAMTKEDHLPLSVGHGKRSSHHGLLSVPRSHKS